MILRKRLLSLALGSCVSSLAVFSQTYNGSMDALRKVTDPPASNITAHCSNYSDTKVHHSKSTCLAAVTAARLMAEKYAQSYGKYIGCLDGFSKGFDDMLNPNLNISIDSIIKENKKYENITIDDAKKRGESDANKQTLTLAASDVVKAYRDAVIRGDTIVNTNFATPEFKYPGVDRGYEITILSKDAAYEQAKSNGWIKEQTAENEVQARKYAMEAILATKMYQYDMDKKVGDYCGNILNGAAFTNHYKKRPDSNEYIYEYRFGRLSFWDYYRDRQIGYFKDYYWQNADAAWEVLYYFERDLDHYKTFSGINDLEKRVPEKQKVLVREKVKVIDPETNEQVVIDGVPQWEWKETWEETGDVIEVIKPLTADEKSNLRKIYQNVFKEAYFYSFSQQYASKAYIESAIAAEKYGQTAGTLIGQMVAEEVYEQVAYDIAFKRDSKVAFFKQIDTKFQNQITTYAEIFEKNPVFELNNVTVVGETKDNIFRANENLSVDYSIYNLGLVEGSRNLHLQGNGLTNQSPESIAIPRLGQANGSAGILATVGDYSIGTTVGAVFSIEQGPTLEDIDNVLILNKSVPFGINDYAEIKSIKKVLADAETGTITIEVTFTHPANPNLITTTEAIGTLSSEKGVLNEQTLNVIYKGAETEVQFTSVVDPLVFINNRALSFSVSNEIEGRTTEVESDNIATIPYQTAVLKHFEAIVSGRSKNCGITTCEQRIEKLFDYIDGIIEGEISTKWHKNYHSTFLYTLKNSYNSIKSNNTNPNYQTIFDRLVSERLIKRLKQVKPGAFNGPRKAKKAYFKILKSMAPKKLTQKWKKYL